MASAPSKEAAQEKLSWSFPATFWYANGAELCERAAYYGMFITLMRYLNQDVGFTDAQAGIITATFSSLLYFFPTFMGIMADRIGFKAALIVAFGFLTGGYALLGALQLKVTVLIALGLIMLGGAVIKPVISGTAAKCSDATNRARAMSIFYMVVNIGSFTGKGLAAELNTSFGLQYIIFYASGMSFLALLLVAFFYKNPDVEGVGKTVEEALRGLFRVILNLRFVALIVIIGGFWAIQGQLYGAMPTYIERLLGAAYQPEWLANINPLVVVICVVPITHLVLNFKPASAIGIGLLIIPFTALLVALAPMLQGVVGRDIAVPGVAVPHAVFWPVVIGVMGVLVGLLIRDLRRGRGARLVIPLIILGAILAALILKGKVLQADAVQLGGFSIHPMILMFIIGIGLQGLAECFLSPKWLEFASKQAPKGEVGLYLGFSHLTTCVSWAFTFILAGYLLEGYCPDPRTLDLETRNQWRQATDRHYDFTVDGDFKGELPKEGPLPESVATALATHGLAIPADATIAKGKPEGVTVHQKDVWTVHAGDHEFLLATVALENPKSSATWTELLALSAEPHAPTAEVPAVYSRAHYIWYVFTGVGVAAFVGLLIFKFVTEAIDRRRGVTSSDSAATPAH